MHKKCAKREMEDVAGEIWHVYSDGALTENPFDSDEDKVYAWNSIAISAESAGVKVLVATVTGKELHAMVRSEEEGEKGEEEVRRFKTALQRRVNNCRRTGREWAEGGYIERKHFACSRISTRKEALQKFMYVYRICMDSYRKMPGEYPWGSGNIYFSEPKTRPACSRMGDFTVRERLLLFGSRKKLPEEWLVDTGGRILPESFIDYSYVERLFRTARTFIAFLHIRREDEAALKQEIHRNYLESRSFQDLRKIGNEYCVRYCGKTLVKVDVRIRLAIAAKMVREDIAGRTASLAKALLLQEDDLAKIG